MHEDNNGGRIQVYELGYHIVPTISEGDLPQEVNFLRSVIEENKGIIISEEFPKNRELSYTISKVVNGVKLKCDNAYFGWVKFEIGRDGVSAVKEAADKHPHILRFLLIKTVKENTVYGPRLAQSVKMQGGEGRKEKVEPEKPKMSAEEIDKTIDEMVKE